MTLDDMRTMIYIGTVALVLQCTGCGKQQEPEGPHGLAYQFFVYDRISVTKRQENAIRTVAARNGANLSVLAADRDADLLISLGKRGVDLIPSLVVITNGVDAAVYQGQSEIAEFLTKQDEDIQQKCGR